MSSCKYKRGEKFFKDKFADHFYQALVKIDNTIQSNPKLTVVGVVIIPEGLFIDKSNTLRNMTVIANRTGQIVEQHNCTYVEMANRNEYFDIDVHFCSINETKFHFKKLEVGKDYKFTIEACNTAGCKTMVKEHNTLNW